jgi:hypothetical protein
LASREELAVFEVGIMKHLVETGSIKKAKPKHKPAPAQRKRKTAS